MLCVMMTADGVAISQRVGDVAVVQPVRENIWVVAPDVGSGADTIPTAGADARDGSNGPDSCADGARIFRISYGRGGGSFGGIFSEIGRFRSGAGAAGSRGAANLRILGGA